MYLIVPCLSCLQPAAAAARLPDMVHFTLHMLVTICTQSLCSASLGLLLAVSARGKGHGLAAPVQAQRGARKPYICPQLRLHIAPVLIGEQLRVVDEEDERWWADSSLHTMALVSAGSFCNGCCIRDTRRQSQIDTTQQNSIASTLAEFCEPSSYTVAGKLRQCIRNGRPDICSDPAQEMAHRSSVVKDVMKPTSQNRDHNHKTSW